MSDVVEVKEHTRVDIGLGLFIAARHVKKGTRVAFFGGQVIRCVDENGCKIRDPPRGTYVLCLNPDVRDPAHRIYLDTFVKPLFGERGFNAEFVAQYANSSHPLAEAPFDKPNSIFESCPDEPTLSCLKLTQDLKYGDEIIWDYHYQLVKKKIYGSCGSKSCGDCRSAKSTPLWTETEKALQRPNKRKVIQLGFVPSPGASPKKASTYVNSIHLEEGHRGAM